MTVARMAAIGMDLPEESFTERMKGGDHLLAPTASDLEKNKKGSIFAGFHYGTPNQSNFFYILQDYISSLLYHNTAKY